jgi:hypothetical protein
MKAEDIRKLVLVSDEVWYSHEWVELGPNEYYCTRCKLRGKGEYLVVEVLNCDEFLIKNIIE